ncbi:hypothetical protein CORC01_00951 [Colletotrichum orchidophilum]|uniref:Uncharacterized protein n=1 Tax=Colletotrichum orchidophilum TaxID=1209926 RepID=A0A1G4BQA1_9PEZI|nr:uncharacterized protein CORC01_00951 [Colletotrichum orchidophilum]OHF03632.1 hypothetical protein CORC01_00951 [Colletotrichum orchidophilum]
MDNLNIRTKDDTNASGNIQLTEIGPKALTREIITMQNATRDVIQALQHSGAEESYIQAFNEQQNSIIDIARKAEKAAQEVDQMTLASKNMLKYANLVGPELSIASDKYDFLSQDYRDNMKRMVGIERKQDEVLHLKNKVVTLEARMVEADNKNANLERHFAEACQVIELLKKDVEDMKAKKSALEV